MGIKKTLKDLVRPVWDPIRYNGWLSRLLSGRAIFILGVQRSGTTLTFMLVSSHADVIGFDESVVGTQSFPSVFRLLFAFLRRKYVCYKLPAATYQLALFSSRYPKAKIIFLIRNPLEVVASMKALADRSGNWIQSQSGWELDKLEKLYPELREAASKNAESDEVATAAILWRFKNRLWEALRTRPMSCLLKYEEVLECPERALKTVCERIGIPWSDEILRYQEVHRGKKYAGGTTAERKISRRESTVKLTASDKKKIRAICHELMVEHGYYTEDAKHARG